MRNIQKLFSHNALPDNEYLVEHRSVSAEGMLMGHITRAECSGAVFMPIHTLLTWGVAAAGKFDYALDIVFEDLGERLLDIAFIGDIAVISTTEQTTYHIFKDGEYTLNRSLSEIPDIQIGITNHEEGEYIVSPMQSKDTWQEAISEYLKKINEKREQKRYPNGHIVIIAAYQMTDGTTIKHSMPYYFPVGRYGMHDNIGIDQFALPSDPTKIKYQVFDYYTSWIKYKIDQVIPGAWESVIRSVDIYAWYIPSVTVPETVEFAGKANEKILFPVKDLEKEFKSAIFHKIDTISVTSLTPGGDIHIDVENDVDLTNLENKEALKPDQLTMHELCFHKAMTYNSRVHAADILTHLHPGHKWHLPYMDWQNEKNERYIKTQAFLYFLGNPIPHTIELSDFSLITSGRQSQPMIRVTVNTTEGDIAVYRELPEDIYLVKPTGSTIYWMILPKIFTYPHPGAKKMELCIADPEGNSLVLYSAEMQQHEMYSFAYHIFPHQAHPVDGALEYVFSENGFSSFIPLAKEQWRPYRDKNRLQLSWLNNPFYWPAVNSYRIGEDKSNRIIDMAVQSTPTSEGQFGQFPLVVFAMNGVYVVDQGQDGIIYTTVRGISNIQANPGVLGIDGAVIFSSSFDMYLVEGRSVKPLGRNIIQNKVYNTENTNTPESPVTDDVHGLTFIQNMRFGYDQYYREIIIANPAYNHHYKLSPASGLFTRAGQGFNGFVVKDGQYEGYTIHGQQKKQVKIYSMADDQGETNVNVFFKTNTLNLGYEGYKKLNRVQYFCHAETPADVGYLNMFIFGGNIINEAPIPILQYSKVTDEEEVVHLIAGKTRVSVRYFVFMLSGKVNAEAVFHYLATDVTPILPGKLR
jgi:hypothetical protein